MIRRLILILIAAVIVTHLFGCSFEINKDDIIGTYDRVIDFFGRCALTPDFLLEGQREFGGSNYEGTYNAEVYSVTKDETIFGGTTLSHAGMMMNIQAHISKDSGNILLKAVSGIDETSFYPDENGDITATLEIQGSFYVVLEYDNFSGSVDVICTISQ